MTNRYHVLSQQKVAATERCMAEGIETEDARQPCQLDTAVETDAEIAFRTAELVKITKQELAEAAETFLPELRQKGPYKSGEKAHRPKSPTSTAIVAAELGAEKDGDGGAQMVSV